MDRVNLILLALTFSPENAEDGDSDEVRSAHADFKGRVEHHIGGHADAKGALEQYRENQKEGRERLKEVLDSTGAVGDFDLVVAAQRLMTLVDPEGAAEGKYAVPPQPLGLSIGH